MACCLLLMCLLTSVTHNPYGHLQGCPKKVAVLGAASPIGMAVAGIFAAFGSEVHVVCPDDLPLTRGADKEVDGARLNMWHCRQTGHCFRGL